jgi:hypothetical protein
MTRRIRKNMKSDKSLSRRIENPRIGLAAVFALHVGTKVEARLVDGVGDGFRSHGSDLACEDERN